MTPDAPSCADGSDGFDEGWYVERYPDVRLSGLPPRVHYEKVGRRLGRPGVAPQPDESSRPVRSRSASTGSESSLAGDEKAFGAFNAESYLLANPDLRAAVPVEACFEHWRSRGLSEARKGAGVSPFAMRMPWRGAPGRDRPHVVYMGPVSAASGLGAAARGYARAIRACHPDAEIIDSTAALHPDRPGEIAAPARKPDILILHQNADAFGHLFRHVDVTLLDDTYVIAVWVWELLAFNPQWRDLFVAVDEVWVPSRFVAEAVASVAPAGLHVAVMPHVVGAPSAAAGRGRRDFGIPQDNFVFLCVFDASSTLARKNPEAALDAFRAAFGDDPRVTLVMKYHSSAGSAQRLARLRREHERFNVIFIDQLLDAADAAALKHVADCLVSPHRSEGFGLNIAEMMALGKPVIVTDYGGSRDFCNSGTAFTVPARLREVSELNPHYPAGAVWGDPDVAALTARLQQVFADRDTAAQIGEAGRALVAAQFDADTVGAAMAERIATVWTGRAQAAARHAREWPGRRQLAWRHSDALAAADFSGADWPTLSVIVPCYNVEPEWLRECVGSVLAQGYPHWELCLCDDASTNPGTLALLDELAASDQRIRIRRLAANLGISGASNAAVEMASGDYCAFLDNDDTLAANALESYARAIRSNPDADLFYCDEDKIAPGGEATESYFKPDWSPEHLESCMYVLHMLVVRKARFLELGGFRAAYTGAQDYDLALRIAREGGAIIHVPQLLYHWRIIPGSAAAEVDAKPAALANAMSALVDHVAHRYGPDAWVEDGFHPGQYRVRRGLVVRPPVTLVITTDNQEREVAGRGRINLLENFLASIVRSTDYDNYRVHIVSNGVLSPGVRQIAAERGFREYVHEYSGPFNFARKANFAISSVETEHFVLLNDDMEVCDEGWLRALMDHVVKEEVGAVGAQLLYPDERIQHAGVVLGVNETCAHVFHGEPATNPGYNGFASIVRNYSAVTGACLASKRSAYNAVSGFDPLFRIDYNDIDYCLKLGEAGYRVVYTPFARLFHFEGQTAVRSEQDPAERALFLERWREQIVRDPYFNSKFSRSTLAFQPDPVIWP